MRHKILHSFLFILLSLILSACIPEATVPSFDDLFGGSSTELEQERLIFISSETVPCGAANCLLVRNSEEGSWEQLEVAIIGFEYAANTAYTLRVREDTISDTPVLRLVDIVSQSFEAPAAEEVAEEITNEGAEEVETAEGEAAETATTEEASTEQAEAATDATSESTSESASEAGTTEETETEVLETISERELLLFIDQVLGACNSETDDRCLRVRENRTDPWRNITGTIANFDYIPGNYYVLRVLERTITTQNTTQNTGQNASSQPTTILEYGLIDLVSQTPATQEKLVYIGPEILSCDEVAAERCYQYKESRSLDYDAKAMDIIGFNHLDGYAYALNLLATLDENGQVRDYELIEVVSKELLDDGRFLEKVIYVGPELVECAFGPSGLCYVFRESTEEPFRVLTAEITGFKHQAGFDYELKVRQQVSQPTINASTTTLELVEILYQEAVVVEEVVEEVVVEETPETATEETVNTENTETTTEANAEATSEENIGETAEVTVPTVPTINETIAGAAQAQLENTGVVTTNTENSEEASGEVTSESTGFPGPITPPTTAEVERRSVTITVAPPTQAPLAVPTVNTTEENAVETTVENTQEGTSEVEAVESVVEEVAVETTEAPLETTTETPVETTVENTVNNNTQNAQGEKSVPVADFGDLEPTNERNKIIFIGSSYEECDSVGQPQWCYLSKENLNDEWFLLPFGIANFDYKEGFVYVLRVKELFYGDDPETGLANYKLELIDVLAETEDKSINIIKEAERREEEASALEEAAIIAQTFEAEAVVIQEEVVVDRTAEYIAEAEKIAADTKAAIEAYEREQALLAELTAEAKAIQEDTLAAQEEIAKRAEEEANRVAAEEEAARQGREAAIAIALEVQAAQEAQAALDAEAAQAQAALDAQAAAEAQAASNAETTNTTETTTTTATAEVVQQSASTATITPDTTTETNTETLGTTSETKTVYIAEQLTLCQPEGLPEQLCYAYKETPEDDWQLLYNEIVNFEFFEGYIYELEVIEYIAQDLPIELGRWFEVVQMTNAFPVTTGN